MEWSQVITIIVSIIGTLGGFLFWIFSKLDGDINSVSKKLDSDTKAQIIRIDKLNARTDQLYQMFIDLLKEQRK